MTADGVVEPLDIVEHICSGLVPGALGFSLGAFGFQRREEALHRCVIPDVAGSAYAAKDAAVGHQALELFTAYWLPRSEWCIKASGLPRRQTAINRASTTS